jgi:hypothetical protein
MYPKLTKEVLENLLRTACELSGKGYNERLIDLYWEFLRDIPMKDVRKAFMAYNACGVFPSCAKVMLHCGVNPPETESKRSTTPTPEAASEYLRDDGKHLTEYGSWTFECCKITDSEILATQEFDAARAKLLKLGWQIEQEIPYECLIEVQEGKYTRHQKVWKRQFWAHRPSPGSEPVARSAKSVAEMESLVLKYRAQHAH